MSDPVRIFCSYSHKDEQHLNALKAHLAEVRRQGLIEDWHDRRIAMGTDWSQAIESALEEADLVLLLVSSDFLASDYCNGIELKRAMERAQAGETRVLPVYLRPVRWKGAPFSRFQGVPTDAKPVTSWDDPDEAWKQVTDGIVRAVREIRGEAEPKRGPFARSPGLERSRFNPRLAVLASVVLLLLGLAVWWLHWPPDQALSDRLAVGDALLDSGRYAQALDSYEQALELDSGSTEAALGRDKAALFAHIGPGFDASAVRTRLLTMARNHQRDPHIQTMLGRLAAAEGDSAEARDRYRQALELDPGLPQALFGLGLLDHAEGRLDTAQDHYRNALKRAPGQPRYLTNLADLLLARGDHAAALEIYNRLLRLNPDLLLARLDAGNAARLAGKQGAATAHHKRLLHDLDDPGILERGDNAAQWAFDLPESEVTMDAPGSKRAYALLSVSVTRFLGGDQTGATELRDLAAGSPELPRALAVLGHDLDRLEQYRPEWAGRIRDYRQEPVQ